jgi:hypothetical protein
MAAPEGRGYCTRETLIACHEIPASTLLVSRPAAAPYSIPTAPALRGTAFTSRRCWKLYQTLGVRCHKPGNSRGRRVSLKSGQSLLLHHPARVVIVDVSDAIGELEFPLSAETSFSSLQCRTLLSHILQR